MAHSTATGEINYFFQDETGKILKVLKQTDIKQEPALYGTSVNSSNNSNMGAYNQLSPSNKSQFVRIHDGYNIQTTENTAYTVITPAQNNSNSVAVKYETTPDTYNGTRANGIKSDSYPKYTQNNNSNTKTKSKIHITHSTHASVQKKRKPEKAGKGLRHFSMKVCEKVKEKGTTTYNEVADELVNEEVKNNSFDAANCDQKNIRRRVYDALNVLMAMQIIAKDKKEIRWIGLPSSSVEQCSELERENEERRERIEQKHIQLRELLLQQVSFKSLIERNKIAERQGIIPTPNSSIQLPFIIVNTHKLTKINCSVTNDKSEYIFKFDDQFEMHDDAQVLKRMGLLYGLDKGQCSLDDIERAKMHVPPNFEKYIEAYGNGKGVITCQSDSNDMPSYMELTNINNNNDSQGYSRTTDGDIKSPECDEDDEQFLDNSDID